MIPRRSRGTPGRRHRPWRNWAGNLRARPRRTFFPESREDLCAIVRQAGSAGRKVRVAGSSFSWEPLVPTDDCLVCVERLKRVTVDEESPEGPTVTAESGATVGEVLRELDRHSLTLPTSVSVLGASVGGVVSTASHGSAWDLGTVSDFVTSLVIVDGRGDARTFTEAEVGEEAMNAARASLGLFGILHEITLRVIPSYNVRVVEQTDLDLHATLDRLSEIVPRHDACELLWLPFSGRLSLKVMDRTEELASRRRLGRAGRTVQNLAVVTAGSLVGCWLRLRPWHTPAAGRLLARLLAGGERVESLRDAVHFEYLELLKDQVMEIALPVDDGFATVRRAWRLVLDRVEAHAERDRWPVNLAVDSRFLGESRAWLSPARGNAYTCYLEIASHPGARDWEAFVAEVGAELLELPGARPHWAKLYSRIPGFERSIRRAYGADLESFLAIRESVSGWIRTGCSSTTSSTGYSSAGSRAAAPAAPEKRT